MDSILMNSKTKMTFHECGNSAETVQSEAATVTAHKHGRRRIRQPHMGMGMDSKTEIRAAVPSPAAQSWVIHTASLRILPG